MVLLKSDCALSHSLRTIPTLLRQGALLVRRQKHTSIHLESHYAVPTLEIMLPLLTTQLDLQPKDPKHYLKKNNR